MRTFAIPTAIVVASIALRLIWLGDASQPPRGDETFYVPNARDVLRYGTEADTRASTPFNVVHPPVGKWFIAAGMKIFGVGDPFGARFFGALVSVLGILLVYGSARRLFRSRGWGAVAAALIALDGLWFAMSQIAMLDVYFVVFCLGVLYLVLRARDMTEGPKRTLVLMLAGVVAGLGVGTKWAAAPLLFAIFILGAVWERRRWRVGSDGETSSRAIRRDVAALRLLIACTIVPAIVYVGSYAPWFLDAHRSGLAPRCQQRGAVSLWVCTQIEMFRQLEGPLVSRDPDIQPLQQRYQAGAWTWPWIGRPFHPLRFEVGTSRVAEVITIPNPLTWVVGFVWFAVYGVSSVARRIARRNDPGREGDAGVVTMALFAAAWLPFIARSVSSQVYFYYALALCPAIAFAVTLILRELVRRYRRGRVAAVSFIAAAAMLFAFFLPVTAAIPISEHGPLGSEARMWLRLDCEEPGKQIACWR